MTTVSNFETKVYWSMVILKLHFLGTVNVVNLRTSALIQKPLETSVLFKNFFQRYDFIMKMFEPILYVRDIKLRKHQKICENTAKRIFYIECRFEYLLLCAFSKFLCPKIK